MKIFFKKIICKNIIRILPNKNNNRRSRIIKYLYSDQERIYKMIIFFFFKSLNKWMMDGGYKWWKVIYNIMY